MFEIAWSALVTATVVDQWLSRTVSGTQFCDWAVAMWKQLHQCALSRWHKVAWTVSSMHGGLVRVHAVALLKAVSITLGRSCARVVNQVTSMLELKDTIVNNYAWTWWPLRHRIPQRTAAGTVTPASLHTSLRSVSYCFRTIVSSETISPKSAS